MRKLSELPNIGKVTEKLLMENGIETPEDLYMAGSKEAFLKIRQIDSTACIRMLYGLEGAVQGIRWHNLPKERKEELKEFLHLRRI